MPKWTEEDFRYFEEFLIRRRIIAQREYDKNDDDDFKLPEYIGEPDDK